MIMTPRKGCRPLPNNGARLCNFERLPFWIGLNYTSPVLTSITYVFYPTV